ncbi:MAG TPA: hypothetical protein VD932_02205, partial [Aquabacterium sp.]|nr:hypothetical protein [Aquabacterium sp.]
LDLSQYRPKFTCPYCGSTGRGSPCRLCGGNGSIFNFNWNQPDKAIKDWFLARGASRHSVAAEGPLSNRDKRDAMLAACFGESQR